jgi:hypothetical protein
MGNPKGSPKLFNFIEQTRKIEKQPIGTWTLWGKQPLFGLFPTPLPGGETANVLKPCSISVFTLGPGKVQRRVWLN